MNVAARGPAGALGRGPARSRRRAARPFEYGRRASMASLRIGEPPRSRARGPQGPFVQVLNCPPKRVRSKPTCASRLQPTGITLAPNPDPSHNECGTSTKSHKNTICHGRIWRTSTDCISGCLRAVRSLDPAAQHPRPANGQRARALPLPFDKFGGGTHYGLRELEDRKGGR